MTSFCNSRVRPLLAITKNSSLSILALVLRQEGYGHLLYTCLWFRYRKDKDNSASVIYLKNIHYLQQEVLALVCFTETT